MPQQQTTQNQCVCRASLHTLAEGVLPEAMHDSAKREQRPKCHPGTRVSATEDIIRWIEDPNPSSTVLWVHGAEGVGKTALMQRIAELEGIYYGGSFFFERGESGQDVIRYLFSTLAYQLALSTPGMREHVASAINWDPLLTKKNPACQLQTLIVEPMRLLPRTLPRPVVIIIDGLNECKGRNSQHKILQLIGEVAEDPTVHIRFIIASRPEHQICYMFCEEPLLSRTRPLDLDSEDYDTAADIELYVREQFQSLRESSRDVMPHFGGILPSEQELEELVEQLCAYRQFAYPGAVINFCYGSWCAS
ncbi:hypothetical protein M413DRAFT_412590 [Hebeloma cylindrosporum]|uniref:Nephrocystin 3-like N-terminal domain-containing protein n=1 Tax=Hebeloma cylindrosporum TaxID=76867 RepID=A0A0C3C8R7_HEBCY|nr:hypothetical protein M413DRAFT_412590 [Hebeloma cylindrosporum h7]